MPHCLPHDAATRTRRCRGRLRSLRPVLSTDWVGTRYASFVLTMVRVPSRPARCCLLMVAHERAFLNNVATDVVWMTRKSLRYFRGNYDAFEETRAKARVI